MKKSLPWKLLLPLGLIIWLIGKAFSNSVIGSAAAVLGLLLFLFGIVDAIRQAVKRKQMPAQTKE